MQIKNESIKVWGSRVVNERLFKNMKQHYDYMCK